MSKKTIFLPDEHFRNLSRRWRVCSSGFHRVKNHFFFLTRKTFRNQSIFIILFISLIVAICCFFWGARVQANDNYDRKFILNRAVELAQFAPNEKIVLPEIKYSLPGDDKIRGLGLDSSVQRIVTIIDPAYGLGGVQAVFSAPTYKIIDANKSLSVKSFKRVVGDVLSENNFEIAKEDMVEPGLSSEADTKKDIKITRVSVAQIQEFETLPYQTKKIDDNTLDLGKTKVSQNGKTGKKTLTYQVRREDGVEVSRTLVSQEISTEPIDEIIKIGTKITVLSSVRGYATATNLSNAVVSPKYRVGTLLRITNLSNGVSVTKKVNYTWGTVSAPQGIVLDLSWSILDELKFSGNDKGPVVLVEELKQ